MSLLRRKSGPAKGKSTGQAASEVLVDESTGRQLVVGLNWRTMAGGDKVSKFLSEQRPKPTHYLLRDVQVGFCTLPEQAKVKLAKGQGTSLYPAALLVARAFMSATCIFMRLSDALEPQIFDDEAEGLAQGAGPEEKFWVCLVRNGQTTSTDEILHLSESQAIEHVRNIVQAIDDELVSVYTNVEFSGLEHASSFSMSELYNLHAEDGCQLLLSKSEIGIPRPLLMVLLAGMGLMAANLGWEQYEQYQRRKLDAMAGGQAAAEVEQGYAQWRQVFAERMASVPAGQANGLNVLGASVMQLPALVDGWLLSRVECKAMFVAPDAKTWNCLATYDRRDTGAITSKALSEVFAKMLPSMALAFPSLNTTTASWQVKDKFKAIDASRLDKAAAIHVGTLSAMQTLVPALSSEPVITKVPVVVQAPKNPKGVDYEKPADLPSVSQVQIAMKGPWRSMQYIAQKHSQYDWDSVNLTFTYDDRGQRDLKSSSVMADMTGSRAVMD